MSTNRGRQDRHRGRCARAWSFSNVTVMTSQTSVEASSFSEHPVLHLTVLGIVLVIILAAAVLRRRPK